MLKFQTLMRMFNLRHDQASTQDIDAAIRANARAGGTNLWVLFFAILIASVGLNVNSTAVIIGAMLISPLMGPIVGMGYGAAIADTSLMRSSAATLLGFTLVSLSTAILYFAISPLDEPGSELLARTSPNLWDVLIAAFGGAAGMVAVTRRSFTNIAPGVAIATALMPPLCTVGFGIAHQRWDMAAGAAYLFVINSVFIASATLLVGKVLRLPRIQELSASAQKLHRWIITVCLLAVLIPSVWLGYRFAQEEYFKAAAASALRSLPNSEAVVHRDIDHKTRRINLVVVGQVDEVAMRSATEAALAKNGIRQAAITINRPDATLWKDQQAKASARDEEIRLLLGQVRDLQDQVTRLQNTVDTLPPVPAPAQLSAEPAKHNTPHHKNK
jgi:uncharacterized hydrophobic protein (TIGR00271 family)